MRFSSSLIAILLTCGIACCVSAQSMQQDLDLLNHKRVQHSRNGMIALGSWATANIAGGAVGYFTAKDKETKHFWEMNLWWNTVNLGLAVPGLIGSLREQKRGTEGWSFERSYKKAQATRTTFLVNGVLDLSYMTAGAFMSFMHTPARPELQPRLRGYGKSMLVQGGFLCLFDLVEYFLHGKNMRRLDPYWQNRGFSLHFGGNGLVLRF